MNNPEDRNPQGSNMSIVVNNVTIHNPKFDPMKAEVYHSINAYDLGLKSMTDWKRLGRVLKPDAVPAGIVSTQELRSKGFAVHPVVRDVGNGYFLVSTKWHPVYPEDQTEPKAKKKEKTTSSSLTSLSYSLVSRVETETEQKSLQNKSDSVVGIMGQTRRGRPRVNSGYWAYCPTLRQDHIDALGQDIERAMCVIHTLHQFRFLGDCKRGKEDWIELGSVWCKKLFGWDNWTRTRDKLFGLDILMQIKVETLEDEYGLGLGDTVVDERGKPGKSAYAYRLGDFYRGAKHTRQDLHHPHTHAMLEKAKGKKLEPVHRWIERNLLKISIEPVPEDHLIELARQDTDEGTVEAKVDAYRESVRWIEDRSFFIKVDDFSGRIHTNITNLKSELRAYLRVNGQPLCQIDIKNAQPTFIGLLAKKAGYHDARYIELCQADLYEWIAGKMSLTRNEIKEQLTQRGLFSKNSSKHQKTPVMKFFKKEFPEIHKYMTEAKTGTKTKDNPKPHNRLAMLAQSAEVDLVVHRVCKRLRKERPDMFVTTIHDSIVMLRPDADHVKLVMAEEFLRLDLDPNLKVESYVPEDPDRPAEEASDAG